MPTSPNIKLPGRLGNPEMKFFQEPRAHPKLAAALKMFGADGSGRDPFAGRTFEELSSAEFMGKSDAGAMMIYNSLPIDLPGDEHEPKVEQSTATFKSFDGAERTLYVFRRADITEPVPAVCYIHGGGMVTGQTNNKVHMRWGKSIAVQGVVAIVIDFRNAWTKQGVNPFPTGLNDCVAGFKYVSAHRKELGITKIVLQGESGGANLSIATALKANKEGWVDQIAGVYGCVPYISNAYAWTDERKLEELPSLYENDGYFLTCRPMAGMSFFYAPNDPTNPLAWPYHATVDDCVGLPPHKITVDELDPLRDEGMAYYRKLLAAGVTVTAQVNLGIVHATSLIFRQLLPEIYNETVNDIASFAKRL